MHVDNPLVQRLHYQGIAFFAREAWVMLGLWNKPRSMGRVNADLFSLFESLIYFRACSLEMTRTQLIQDSLDHFSPLANSTLTSCQTKEYRSSRCFLITGKLSTWRKQDICDYITLVLYGCYFHTGCFQRRRVKAENNTWNVRNWV